jgi:23S rRNA (guanosine2251-2'-O)-methyltransferase
MKIWGRRSVLEAVNNPARSISKIRVARGSEDGLEEILEAARGRGIEVKVEERKVLDRITDEGRHQGVIAEAAELGLMSLENLLRTPSRNSFGPLYLILDEVEDPRNLGALVRSAAAAGCDGVMITERRSAPLDGSAQKAAAGGLEKVPITQVGNLASALDKVREKAWILGADMAAEADYSQVDLRRPIALVLGGEGKGLRDLTKKKCDQLVRIPTEPGFSVLNVSVAAGILLFEARRQRGLRLGC